MWIKPAIKAQQSTLQWNSNWQHNVSNYTIHWSTQLCCSNTLTLMFTTLMTDRQSVHAQRNESREWIRCPLVSFSIYKHFHIITPSINSTTQVHLVTAMHVHLHHVLFHRQKNVHYGNNMVPILFTPHSFNTTDPTTDKLAPYGTDGRLFTTDVSANFKVTWHKN